MNKKVPESKHVKKDLKINNSHYAYMNKVHIPFRLPIIWTSKLVMIVLDSMLGDLVGVFLKSMCE